MRDSNSNSDDYSDSDIIIKNVREQILEQSRAGQSRAEQGRFILFAISNPLFLQYSRIVILKTIND